MHSQIIGPVVTLVAWSLVMCIWMLAVRLPALKRAGIDMSKARGGRPGILDGMVEEQAQWPAHNYNHLMEQPTLFYAIALALAFLGAGDGMNAWIAWAYVAFRILHSIVQATFNKISVRFPLFILSTVALGVLTVQAALVLLHST